MQRVVSSQASSETLYSKLQNATASIRIAEDRAERAEREAEHTMRSCASKLETITATLTASDVARRHAEEALSAASQPDPIAQARVRALEMTAHAARKTARDCDDAADEATREALEEEAAFHTAVAKQARHCLQTGTEPKAVCAHVYARVSTAATTGACADSDGGRGELARLELDVALGRALDAAAQTASGIGARTHGGGTGPSRAHVDRFVRAVSKDLQEGIERESVAYAAASKAGDRAVAR